MFNEINKLAKDLVKNYNPLSAQDEINIIKQNPKNLNEIIFNSQSKFIVGWAMSRFSQYISFQELISTAVLAIDNALKSYDGSHRFNTHLRAHLTSALQEEMVTLNNPIHIPQHLFKQSIKNKQLKAKQALKDEYRKQLLGINPIDDKDLTGNDLADYETIPTFVGNSSKDFSVLDLIGDDVFTDEFTLHQEFVDKAKSILNNWSFDVFQDIAIHGLRKSEIAQKYNVEQQKINKTIKYIKEKLTGAL
jgi:RNA polymerase sigma factor (sigma-70 family)